MGGKINCKCSFLLISAVRVRMTILQLEGDSYNYESSDDNNREFLEGNLVEEWLE
jgi:hypothetical protein